VIRTPAGQARAIAPLIGEERALFAEGRSFPRGTKLRIRYWLWRVSHLPITQRHGGAARGVVLGAATAGLGATACNDRGSSTRLCGVGDTISRQMSKKYLLTQAESIVVRTYAIRFRRSLGAPLPPRTVRARSDATKHATKSETMVGPAAAPMAVPAMLPAGAATDSGKAPVPSVVPRVQTLPVARTTGADTVLIGQLK